MPDRRDSTYAALSAVDAQHLRRHWFDYLDTVEPERAVLHRYCLKLTGSLWDAEDLVQETLLRGFAMTARGDFHGPDSPVRDRRAYLMRTATNLWLDQVRRRRCWGPLAEAEEPSAMDADPSAVGDAVGTVLALTSAREFAAIVLKDVCDYSLADIAGFVGTTVGTVKSALSRARGKLRRQPDAIPDAAARPLVEAFAAALNARDLDRVLELMAEQIKIDVCNVGGGRGRSGLWTEKTLAGTRFEVADVAGTTLVALFAERSRVLNGALRLEGDGRVITRIVDYHYAPETLRGIAEALGLDCRTRGHHQDSGHLPEMIATTTLPWRD